MVRQRGGRKRAMGTRRPMETPAVANQRWSLDFVADQFTDGRRFRILEVYDDCTRECLALVADTSIGGTVRNSVCGAGCAITLERTDRRT